MPRNQIWLYNCYAADGTLLGELEGMSAAHAFDEAGYEFEGCTTVERIKGSGRPSVMPAPLPGTARYLVRYVIEGKRGQRLVRAFSPEAAALAYDGLTNVGAGPVPRRVISVKYHSA